MKRQSTSLLGLFLLAGLLLIGCDAFESPTASSQQSINQLAEENENSISRLQVIHNAADPAVYEVDVYLNDSLALDNFSFRDATPFIDIPADTQLFIGFAPANSESVEDTVSSFPVTFAANETYIAIANGVLDPGGFEENPDGRNIGFTVFLKEEAREESDDMDEVQFIAVHGVTDAPSVDILARNVGALIEGAAYGDITEYLGVEPDEYILDITPAGDNETIIVSYTADLSGLAGGTATLLASGFLSPENNQNGPPFALLAVLADGTVIELPVFEEEVEFPEVVWRPPVTNSNFTLKIGSTLPIKFRLVENGEILEEIQDVYLMVHGPSTEEEIGPGIVMWELGQGRNALRFSEDESQYIANFHTREFDLESGEMYTAVVHDGETDDIIGTYAFPVSDHPGANRGNQP